MSYIIAKASFPEVPKGKETETTPVQRAREISICALFGVEITSLFLLFYHMNIVDQYQCVRSFIRFFDQIE